MVNTHSHPAGHGCGCWTDQQHRLQPAAPHEELSASVRSLVQNVAALDQQRAAAADAGVLRDDSAPLRSSAEPP